MAAAMSPMAQVVERIAKNQDRAQGTRQCDIVILKGKLSKKSWAVISGQERLRSWQTRLRS